MSSTEACARLGVRPQTLYAYVSRGRLHPRKRDGRSQFDVAELDQLAATGRRRARSGRLEVLIDTEVTLLDPAGRLAYRGVDVTRIAGDWTFERTAEWLWSAADDGEPPPWPHTSALAVPASIERAPDRVRAAAALLAAAAPPGDRELGVVDSIGRRAIPALVAGLPRLGPEVAGDDRIAARLWPRLATASATPARLRALDTALVLLADHELAVSTMAARVAASAWAAPLDVVVAGLAAHCGVLHGGASAAVEQALREGRDPASGFGHPIYRDRDPRADLLLPLAETSVGRSRWAAVCGDRLAQERIGAPNIDLVLGLFAVANDLVPGAGEVIFAIARTAGWLAHAAEEYANPFRYRPSASYVGTPPLPA